MVTAKERGLSDTPADAEEMLRQLPKVELHLHLEGSLRPATVCAQARRYEPDSPFCHDGWPARFWSFGDLPGFVADLRQVVHTALRSADDYYTGRARVLRGPGRAAGDLRRGQLWAASPRPALLRAIA